MLYTMYSFLYTNSCQEIELKLGNNLRQYRFGHNEITQQELANAVGVTRVTIHSVETGKFVPSTVLALKLAQFFGVSVDELFFLANGDDNA
jgi:putative transcriptional regulator